MKKFLAILIICFFSITSYAQLNLVGSLGLGGGVISGYLNPSLKDLNSELSKAGLKEFNSGLFGFG
ncbi:MAG: hypothetical protein N3A61_02995, partial [Ignavibacteria bacterium]|nr:hypothetical protein [Ignavibacteria bacterium]